MQAESPSVYERLQTLLPAPKPIEPRGWLDRAQAIQGPWAPGLRSVSQVIFINHPLSGALLLLAFWLSSPWMAGWALVGMTSANAVSHWMRLSPGLRDQGIHGFNGVLVGCATAALANTPMPSAANAARLTLLVAIGGGLTTWIIELWRLRFRRRGDPPVLTLPFCLITWVLLAVVPPSLSTPLEAIQPAAATAPLEALLLGIPHSFGQVFLCSSLISGCLVAIAVVIASPIAAGLGVIGAVIGMTCGLLQGADPSAIAQGLWGYNGVLTAIALGGIFHTPSSRSVLLAVLGASLATLLQALQIHMIGILPPLTLSFVITTWCLQRLAKRRLPALIPVALHAVISPEEHRLRYGVTRALLERFRRHLQERLAGIPRISTASALEEPRNRQTQDLFAELDRNQDGRLSVAELRHALMSNLIQKQAESNDPSLDDQLNTVLAAMDLNLDGQINLLEFGHFIQHLQRLRDGEERLRLYLIPMDTNGDDQLEPNELDRLLRSVGQTNLTSAETTLVYANHPEGLSWRQWIDQLLLA